jgi:hypothetical protein
MCRVDHIEIGHNDSSEDRCPLCRCIDERDELREVLGDILYWMEEGMPLDEMSTPIRDAERILAKYPKA